MDWNVLWDGLPDHTLDGLTRGAIYALVALGYTLVYGVMRLINFAHSEVFMVGTFAVLGVYAALGATVGMGWPAVVGITLVALAAAVAASASTALAVERIAYRPLRRKNAPPLIFLITAIGCSLTLLEIFGFVLYEFFGSPFGRGVVSIDPIFPSRNLVETDLINITNVELLVMVSALVMMVGLDWFVNRSRIGRGIRAVAQSPDNAALMGINQERVIMLVFVVGGAMAGVAALLWTIRYDVTKFDVGFIIGIKAFTAAVLGGIGNLRGALLGGLLLGVIEVYFSVLVDSSWVDVTAFVVLVLVLMFRPTGLLGESLGKARA
ncbi:MAG TPA: branched-chain amino acid ABC transporter permease [Nocardioidaceae bacterium]|nr:branched-chain amino acid ABC transporter permease [Nocardioidaceae bacterium]